MENIKNALNLILPDLQILDFEKLESDAFIISAIGFEDRSVSFIKSSIDKKIRFNKYFAIKYLPFNKRNKIDEYKSLLHNSGVLDKNIVEMTYDRHDPELFINDEFLKLLSITQDKQKIYIDISAMSKLLILVLLQELSKLNIDISIVYTEAKTYHPTKLEYFFEKIRYEKEAKIMPAYLTMGIDEVLTTSNLSTTTMQGYPLLMVAFPTFNYLELLALIHEISIQKFVFIEGMPHLDKNGWRIDAIKFLNNSIFKNLSKMNIMEETVCSTFDYKETLIILEKIYNENKYSKKFILAPTGSKMQTVATFIFKQVHPDIQIIYPITKGFKDLYTNGCENIWILNIGNTNSFLEKMHNFSRRKLLTLINSFDNDIEII